MRFAFEEYAPEEIGLQGMGAAAFLPVCPHREYFKVLVVTVDALKPVDFLDLVLHVLLQFCFAEYRQDVVRIAGAIHQWIASLMRSPGMG